MSAFAEPVDSTYKKASSLRPGKEWLDGKGTKAATATAEAKLNQLHYELAKGLDPKQLQAFMSDEIKSNTEKLIKSMERLDSRLGVVKEVTGIHTRQFNDPTGDWQVDDSSLHYTVISEPPQEPVPGPQPPSKLHKQMMLHNARSREEPRKLPHAQDQKNSSTKQSKAPRLKHEDRPNLDDVLRKNMDLARALYVKEREFLELSRVERDNAEMRRTLLDINSRSMGGSETQQAISRALHRDPRYIEDSLASMGSGLLRTPSSFYPENNYLDDEMLRQSNEMIVDSIREKRGDAYDYIQERVARKLARDKQNDIQRNTGPKSPPSWTIRPHKNKAKSKGNKKVESDEGRVKILSRRERNLKKANRKMKKRQLLEKFDEEGNQSRGHFNSIEMSFGMQNDILDDEEDEIWARYPISHEFSHLGQKHSSRNNRVSKKRAGSIFDPNVSDDMVAYMARVKEKEDQKKKLHEQREKVKHFFPGFSR